ncbi:MAG: hypothetical protein ACSLFN_00815 [Candidatus Limnocylindrales bacterium]
MTTDEAIGRRGVGSSGSVRQRLASIAPARWALLGILALTVAIHGWRALLPFFVRGDLLYHWGLTHTILLGTFPPEGPYLDLPAYYPPGFHLLLAGLASLPGLDVTNATALLGVVWLPVIPLGAYLLARRVSGRSDVGLVAAALTAFAGGLDVSNDRLWVNSLSMVGQVAYPIYPRDLVFGILPFAILAFLNAIDGERRWPAWASLAGVLLGACGLLQVQLLLPIPAALAVVAVVIAWRERERSRVALAALVATGTVALAIVAPWLLSLASTIARNGGGVSIDSSEDLLPIRLGFWGYPIQFGIVLPLAIAGAGVVLLLARRSAGSGTGGAWFERWRPQARLAAIVLLPWWIVPFGLAVLYQPTWPLEDALRPQRMWMVASQPGLILAAIGLVGLVDEVVAGRWRSVPSRARRAAPLLLATILVASLPATLATTRLMTFLWVEPQYAHLSFAADRVPDMGDLLDVTGPRPTVLTYEDWSSLVWYETGAAVVAVEPPGYAKLAFDPEVFTGFSQAERRLDLGRALGGDVQVLTETADRYGADRIVLARRDGALGLIGLPGVVAADLGRVDGASGRVAGNGFDQLALEAGSTLTLAVEAAATGALRLELRAGTDAAIGADGLRPAARVQIRVGDRPPIDLVVPALRDAGLSVLPITVERSPGEPVVIEAIDRVLLQGILGFVRDPGPPPGWRLATETADAVVWQRQP